MYAVVTSGGKQYKVQEGEILRVEKIPGNVGSAVTFDRVLMIADGDKVNLGQPVLDNALEKSGKVNAHYHRVPGYPYLRTTRFLNSLKSESNKPAKNKIWLRWLMEAGTRARLSEIRNFSKSDLKELFNRFNEPVDRQSLITKTETYSEAMMQSDLKIPPRPWC